MKSLFSSFTLVTVTLLLSTLAPLSESVHAKSVTRHSNNEGELIEEGEIRSSLITTPPRDPSPSRDSRSRSHFLNAPLRHRFSPYSRTHLTKTQPPKLRFKIESRPYISLASMDKHLLYGHGNAVAEDVDAAGKWIVTHAPFLENFIRSYQKPRSIIASKEKHAIPQFTSLSCLVHVRPYWDDRGQRNDPLPQDLMNLCSSQIRNRGIVSIEKAYAQAVRQTQKHYRQSRDLLFIIDRTDGSKTLLGRDDIATECTGEKAAGIVANFKFITLNTYMVLRMLYRTESPHIKNTEPFTLPARCLERALSARHKSIKRAVVNRKLGADKFIELTQEILSLIFDYSDGSYRILKDIFTTAKKVNGQWGMMEDQVANGFFLRTDSDFLPLSAPTDTILQFSRYQESKEMVTAHKRLFFIIDAVQKIMTTSFRPST